MTHFETLHDAMVEVLASHGGGWMSRDAIEREIARRDLWRRPSDGQHPPSDQIRLRARKPEYQHLFECSDTACNRVRLRPGVSGTRAKRKPSSRSGDHSKPRRSAGPRRGGNTQWYEELRANYRPERLRVLLVGESPPDPGGGRPRFFYAPELSIDNLYRGVAQALYGLEPDFDVRAKPAVLDRLRADGFWLIDAVEHPVNKYSPAGRRRSIADAVPRLVQRCEELAPERGVIICHSLVFRLASPGIRASRIRLLHATPLPFPIGNWRAQFISGVRAALTE